MSAQVEDYYAVLQVQPDAEPEVIEAAYRQLMRKYHPDVAGTDRERAAVLHERAKSINRAYAVLRDTNQRWIYDRMPPRWGRPEARPSPPPPPPSRPASDGRSASASVKPGTRPTWQPADSGVDARARATSVPPGPRPRGVHLGPLSPLFDGISNLYYLLPGPYEWEGGQDRELLATLTLPLLGVAAWSLFSGRLSWLTGQGPYIGVLAWAALAVLALPLWPILSRLVLAGLPTLLLLTGPAESVLRLAAIPPLLAWSVAGAVGILLSARLYLFTILPTVVVCWTVANASLGQAALESVLRGTNASIATGRLGLLTLTLACLLGMLSLFTLVDWRPSPGRARAKSRAPESPSGQPEPDSDQPGEPLLRRLAVDRVRTLQHVPLRTDRDSREPPCVVLAANQEASVLLIRAPWAFLQTDDGREGWAEWRVAA